MFKKRLSILLFLILFSASLSFGSNKIEYEESIVKCISDHIFINECSGKIQKLTWWNKGESFPSFGIGHSIWYPAGVEEPYQESFPDLIDYYRLRGIKLPEWLEKLDPFYAPWQNRKVFFKKIKQKKLSELRQFLNQTREIQIAFIILRLRNSIPLLTFASSENNQDQMNHKISQLLATPRGIFTLADYINFKGEGTVQKERYQQQGWGALQVIEAMDFPITADAAPELFSKAANQILLRRIRNAPAGKNEKQYLKGWQNRLETYKTFTCH